MPEPDRPSRPANQRVATHDREGVSDRRHARTRTGDLSSSDHRGDASLGAGGAADHVGAQSRDCGSVGDSASGRFVLPSFVHTGSDAAMDAGGCFATGSSSCAADNARSAARLWVWSAYGCCASQNVSRPSGGATAVLHPSGNSLTPADSLGVQLRHPPDQGWTDSPRSAPAVPPLMSLWACGDSRSQRSMNPIGSGSPTG